MAEVQIIGDCEEFQPASSWRDIEVIPWQAARVSMERALCFFIPGVVLGSPPICPPIVVGYAPEHLVLRLSKAASMIEGVAGPCAKVPALKTRRKSEKIGYFYTSTKTIRQLQ